MTTTTPSRQQHHTATPLSTRLRRPLQSPQPSSPLSGANIRENNINSPAPPASQINNDPPRSPPSRHHHQNSNSSASSSSVSYPTSPSNYRGPRHNLSNHQLREIMTIFQLFDPEREGYIDIDSLEVMIRSLGFRMTRVEILGIMESFWEERRQQQQQNLNNYYEKNGVSSSAVEESQRVDLSTAIYILARKGYALRNIEDEIQIYFRMFDGGNKGYITLEDLQRVQREVMEGHEALKCEFGGGGAVGFARGGVNALGDATLRAMIHEFDRNQDGVLDLEEFRALLSPIISS